MPQMMPMNWIFSFTQITFIILLTLIMIFHTPNSSPKNKTTSIKDMNINWKW